MIEKRMPSLAAAAAAGALMLGLSGCAAAEPVGAASAVSTSAADADAYAVVPEPGRTIAARAPEHAEELPGYRIAAVVPTATAGADRLAAALGAFAARAGAEVEVFSAADDGEVGDALAQAVETEPDLVIGLGEGVVDVFSLETAQRLDQQFLIVGAQVAEPTANVTAVIWPGATSRGAAASADGAIEAAAITERRGLDALAAGIASVRDGVTGIVLDLGE
ncbi:BMP family ABC transporter substrate-binding protein [Microbacterium fluvii]|uniref:BMP family ABC transporter substrate-binding protein n=1 Tax=Microbacterium fluvii TaxID=415215 RepID=A0ABW2HAF7_9MICO